MKANHNWFIAEYNELNVVYQYVKDTKWKQITTAYPAAIIVDKLFINMSKIQNESKSQLPKQFQFLKFSCLSICQRYKMKANHN